MSPSTVYCSLHESRNFLFCLCCTFFSRNKTKDWEWCKHTLYIMQHSAHVTAAWGLLHRSPPPPPNPPPTPPPPQKSHASPPLTLWSVMLRRVARLTPGGKSKKGFIRLCCSERRLRVVGKAWGWWCRLFSSQWVKRHLCALHRKHHNLVWWKSERAIWDSTGSGWWLCVCVWVCQVETWHCEWNPILYRATSVAPHE